MKNTGTNLKSMVVLKLQIRFHTKSLLCEFKKKSLLTLLIQLEKSISQAILNLYSSATVVISSLVLLLILEQSITDTLGTEINLLIAPL